MGWSGGIRKVPISESSLKGSIDFSPENKRGKGCPRISVYSYTIAIDPFYCKNWVMKPFKHKKVVRMLEWTPTYCFPDPTINISILLYIYL